MEYHNPLHPLAVSLPGAQRQSLKPHHFPALVHDTQVRIGASIPSAAEVSFLVANSAKTVPEKRSGQASVASSMSRAMKGIRRQN